MAGGCPGRIRAGDGRGGGGAPGQARRSGTGAGGQPRLDSARDRSHGSEDGPRSRAARSHDALARRSGLPVPRRATRGDPAADPGRTRHGGALGRDLSDDAAAPGLSEEDDAMTTDTVPELGSIEPNQHGYRTFTLGKF